MRWRLTLAFAAVMAVVLAATGIFIYARLDSNLDRAVDRGLSARAADVAALAQQSDSGLREARGAATIRRAELAQLIDARGRVLDHTPGVSTQPLISPAALDTARHAGRVVIDAHTAVDQPVRLLAEPVSAQGQRLVVVVGQSLEDRNRALGDLISVLLLGGPAALLLASVAGYLLTGAALAPVEAMRRRAEAISAASLGQRLEPADRRDELGRLGRTLNEMLGRVQASVARERTFVSDASHELRSPLAMLRAELELIARDRPSGPALQDAVSSAIEETDRLSRLADDLLLLARADNQQLAIQTARVGVIELLQAAADRARRRPLGTDIQITINAPAEARIWVDRERVVQALDNLLVNALRFASTHIELAARIGQASVELHVKDDGPGFPADFLPHAWERFARPDAARTEAGSGIGLSIVRTIAERHGGQAHATNQPGGGADVWITVPRAANQAADPHQPALPQATAPLADAARRSSGATR